LRPAVALSMGRLDAHRSDFSLLSVHCGCLYSVCLRTLSWASAPAQAGLSPGGTTRGHPLWPRAGVERPELYPLVAYPHQCAYSGRLAAYCRGVWHGVTPGATDHSQAASLHRRVVPAAVLGLDDPGASARARSGCTDS